jgi:hypothetical protein
MRFKQRQAGVAAVEFILVFPMFVAIVGMIISICLAQWTKMHMTAIAFRAAATCAEVAPIAESTMAACVHGIVDPVIGNTASGGILPWCKGPRVDVQFETGLIPLPQRLLHVTISCRGSWSPFMGALPGLSTGGANFTVATESYMPYTLRTWTYPL